MKTNLKNIITVTVAVPAALVIFTLWPLTVRAGVGIKAAIQQEQNYFLTTYSSQFQTNSQSSVWLKSFLTNSGTLDQLTAQDWLLALRRLVALGKHEDIFFKNTGFIEDAHVVGLLVDGLGDSDREVKGFAVEMLTWQTRDRDLARVATMVKKNLSQPTGDDQFLLLGKLNLSPEEKRTALEKAAQLLPLKARLGDAMARAGLIASFKSQTNYFDKARLAREIGYVGDHESAVALMEGLRSEVCIQGRYQDRSIRLDVLLALGQIFQDEALFTRDAQLLADNSDSTFDRVRGLKSYISDLNTWSQKNFGHPVWESETVWFLKFSNVPIVRPKA